MKSVQSNLLIIDQQIENFTSINIPTHVTKIIAQKVGLKSLKGLPDHVTDLDVSDNCLQSLKYYPQNLINLRASKNIISSLIDISDSKIENLGISYNHLTNFHFAPNTLKSIVAVSNIITCLDGLEVIRSMKKLYISYNKIISMKNCPQKIDILDCSCNLLESFEHIPSDIEELIISNNPLKSDTLIGLSSSRIKLLRCSDCNLKSLAGYPKELKLLEALKNDITNVVDVMDKVNEVFIDQHIKSIKYESIKYESINR
jgi:hypothetical protein